MPANSRSRKNLYWLPYPRSNSVRVINSHLDGGGGLVDPESGLTLTNSFSQGTVLDGSVSRIVSVVFAADMTIPGSPSGLIFELGGIGTGCYVGFRAGGQFVARASVGSTSAPTASAAGLAVVYLTTGQPSGAGTLVWEFNVGNGQIRVWWNSALIGSAQSTSSAFSGSQWAGADNGTYLGTSANLPAGEVSTLLAATSISTLRYYQNQLSSA